MSLTDIIETHNRVFVSTQLYKKKEKKNWITVYQKQIFQQAHTVWQQPFTNILSSHLHRGMQMLFQYPSINQWQIKSTTSHHTHSMNPMHKGNNTC